MSSRSRRAASAASRARSSASAFAFSPGALLGLADLLGGLGSKRLELASQIRGFGLHAHLRLLPQATLGLRLRLLGGGCTRFRLLELSERLVDGLARARIGRDGRRLPRRLRFGARRLHRLPSRRLGGCLHPALRFALQSLLLRLDLLLDLGLEPLLHLRAHGVGGLAADLLTTLGELSLGLTAELLHLGSKPRSEEHTSE